MNKILKAGLIISIVIILTILISKHFKKMNTVSDYLNLPFINKVKENVSQFGNKVIDIANQLGWNAKWLMVVMNNESGLDHKAKNPTSTAEGLIQFMAATLKGMEISYEDFKKMNNVQQLDLVYKYLKPYASKVKDVADAYLAVFFPKALWENDEYVFPTWASKANPIFDIDKNKVLTKKEFKKYVNNKYAQYV